MTINFPASPIDGQTYTKNGVKWKYNSTYSAWLVVDNPILANTTSGQILYNDEDTLKSSSGLSFSAASNTLHVNAVSVAGNITIGSTDVQGVVSSAFSKANTACTNADTAQTIGVAAFSKANTACTNADTAQTIGVAAFSKANTACTNADTAQTIGVAAFSKANTACTNADTAQTIGVAAFSRANSSLLSSSYTASDVLSKLLTVDGSGSGLDADLLDGYQSDVGSTSGPANTIVLRNSSGDDYRRYGFAQYFNMSHSVTTRSSETVFFSSTDAYIRKNDATGMRASLNVPTRTGGDASGTWGISITGDAGTLDGLDSTSFLRSNAGDVFSGGVLAVNNDSAIDITNTGQINGLQIFQPTAGADALISFHVGGDFAFHFGLSGDDNQLSVGGWSMGANKYKVWHAGNDGSGSGLDADLLDGINSSSFLRSDTSATNSSDLRAPIFYDSNNTGYYLDPSSTTLSLNAAGPIYGSLIRSTNASGYLEIGPLNSTYAHYVTDRTYHYFNTHLSVNGTIYDYTDGNYYLDMNNVSYLNDIRPNIIYDRNDTNAYFDSGTIVLRGGSPTIYFRDTDGNSAMLHNNSSYFYLLRGGNDTTSWSVVGSGNWPIVVNLTNNDITVGGNFAAIYNVTAYASDKRLKNNVKEISNAIEKIKKIRGVTFDWNDVADSVGFKPIQKYNDIGVIAQEVQEVIPQAVELAPFDTWKPDPAIEYTQDELNKIGQSKSGENYLTVQLDKIVPLLIEAIKEQQTQIELMKEEIQSLKGVK